MPVRSALLSSAAVMLLAGAAQADSFAISEYSGQDLGRANSGRVVQTDDPSAAFGNPALMSWFDRPQVALGMSAVLGKAEFDDAGSQDVLGNPLGGDTDGFLEDGYIPLGHAIFPINDRVRLGVSLTVPFGLATDYEDDWPGRYQALRSELQTINFSPSLSYKVSDTLSIGAGINIQYADAELSSAIDFGAACFGQLGPETCTSLGLLPQTADGRSVVEGDSTELGWNAGLAWQPHPDWMVGLHYRSGIDHTLSGIAEFDVPPQAQPLTAGGAFQDSRGQAGLDLPASTEIGVSYAATERLTLYGDAIWTEWSSVQELRVEFANPFQPDSVEELKYDDAARYAIGADYDIAPAWTVRAGFAYDETPTPAEFRTARIPDNDRTTYALGATWTPREDVDLNLSYNRVNIEDTQFDKTGNFGDRVTGEFTGHADVISVSATKRF